METKLDVNYVCPKCRSYLLQWNNIILVVRSCTEEREGLLLLDPGLGSYAFIGHQQSDFDKVQCLDYFCPACGSNLIAAEGNSNLASIIMITEDLEEHELYFSRRPGEQSIYELGGGMFIDFFMKYKKKEGGTEITERSGDEEILIRPYSMRN